MIQQLRTSRRVLRSSPSQLVRLHSASHLPHASNRPITELDEEGTRILLTIVDTPGFGDQIDNEARFVESSEHNDMG